MSEEIYIVFERRGKEDPVMTPYLSEGSAKKHYEETIAIYADFKRSPADVPLHENFARTHFTYGNYECGIYKEELYA